MFTVVISCLNISNLPWFMDLTLHILMQYCSLQHQTCLPSPVTSTAGNRFGFGSNSSLFLELFLHSYSVAYCAPTDLRSSSFSVISFCLFILFMGLSRKEGEGNGNPLQYSCLKNPMDSGAWWAAVHRVTQSQTWLKRLSMHACIGEGNGTPLQ